MAVVRCVVLVLQQSQERSPAQARDWDLILEVRTCRIHSLRLCELLWVMPSLLGLPALDH